MFGQVSDGFSDLFRVFKPFSCQIKHFGGPVSFCRRAALMECKFQENNSKTKIYVCNIFWLVCSALVIRF